MQQIEGAFQVSPFQSNNVVALRLEYNSATTPDAWTMDSMGLLSFKPLPASAVAGRTNVMFVDSADSLLKYKDGAGVIKNVKLA